MVEAAWETGLLQPRFGWLFPFPTLGNAPGIIFASDSCENSGSSSVVASNAGLSRRWLSSELGSLRSCLARGGKVGNPSASITLAGPQHPAGGLPVPRNTSKNQNICKTATIQTSNIYPGFLVALQNPISLEVGFRGWSQSRMSTCHRGAGTPLCCEHPKAEPWRWLMPHVVTVKDMGQGLSLPMWNWIFQP